VVTEGDDKPDSSGLDFFLTVDGREGVGTDWPRGPGRVIFNVPPDRYALKVSGNPLRKYYVKAARTGQTDVLAEGLTVASPGTIEIEVVLAADGGSVRGVVRDRDGQPAPGATVLLAPDRRTSADLYQSKTCDQNGLYEFTIVAPGSYKLFSWEDVEPEVWNDPEFLKSYEKQGEKVLLEPRSRATVDLHLAGDVDTP
jgi:hypothetical protein